jgi:signal transduction histidine kinase/DNA-binding response OmpR family regulator
MTSAEPQAPQFSQDTDAQAGCPAPGIDPHKLNFLAGGGELGSLIREHDWAATPLGPPAAWPQSLKTAVRIMLTSRQPIWIGWGADLIYLYNDAYRSIIGGKHPWALGCPTCDVWRELWPDIGPMLATAMEGIEGTYVEDQLLIMERNGYPEETYYTFSYSPIPDDNGAPGGIICANTDDTQRVIGERQVALLRDLATGVVNARSWADACACSVQALAQGQHDLPFSLLYMVDPATQALALVQQHGFTGGAPAAAQSPPAMWRLDGVLKDQQPRLLDDLPPDLAASLAPGVWGKPARHAAALAITAKGHSARAGVLVVGLNPYRLFDESYRGFLSLVAGQIAAALASADAYDEERRRNEALAELDRAKTAFFANVSHEFRTPLTLMLGPLEDMLASPEPAPSVREHIELAHRNGIRLLRLVNTLLDFSRMEAGRVQAHFEPTDLAIFSAEIASSFRSAIEKAGLQFRLEMQPLPEPVFIDREMWEKVLLNLLSNALKFTFDGAIGVRVAADAGGRSALVVISDTGTGIAAAELPRLFERFHRIEGARSRSFEGSGIGLALVQELVKLHGGDIVAESQPGRGTQFTVRLPFGHAHLPADRVLRTQGADGVRRTQGADGVRRTQGADGVLRTQGADGRAIPMRAHEYVDEALRWLPAAATEWHGLSQMASSPLGGTPAAGPLPGAGKTVLLADDNADMRGYVCRLLETQGYTVVPVGNGEAALSAARDAPPDLVLTDVMMPGLDGFGLLRAIRTDPALASVPVIVLSARAGEEAKLEGLQAGADDYLIKPFGARELLARVNANIQMSHIRREASRAIFQSEQKVLMSEDRLSLALSTGRVSIFEWEVESDRVAVLGPMAEAFGIEREAAAHAGLPLSAFMQGIHADDRSLVAAAIERSVAAGAPYHAEYRLHGGGEDRFVIARGQVGVSADGGKRLAGALMDITERLAAQRALQENQAALEDQTRALQTLNRAAAAIAGDLDLQRLAQTITDAGVEITGADRGAFFYYAADHENEPRQVYATQGAAGFIDLELHAGAPGSAVFAGVTRYQDITENPGCLQEHAPRRDG